jgi:hypothetical protein
MEEQQAFPWPAPGDGEDVVDRYRAVCDGCGHGGVMYRRRDGRGGTHRCYEGFDLVSLDDGTVKPVCPDCGGRTVSVTVAM